MAPPFPLRSIMPHRPGGRGSLLLLGLLLWPAPAQAVLDVEDRGPLVDIGRFRMRVTNAGILGNAFYGASRSSDPSFEYPSYSGIEMLNRAELWVGAIDEDNEPRVSGGPMLEFRPTLDPLDRVRIALRSELGRRRGADDDGDGEADEERLNGRDDDGDGEVDEDLGLFADQDAGCEYVDDRPEAVNYGFPSGESHRPLGLTVQQVASAWGRLEYASACILSFRVTNHGVKTLRDVYLGLYADLDSRRREDRSGHRNDRIEFGHYQASKFEGLSKAHNGGRIPCGMPGLCPPVPCFTTLTGEVAIVTDGPAGSDLPAVAVMGIEHTLDPLSRVSPAYGRAPAERSFTTSIFSTEGVPGGGGAPAVDSDRYAALRGDYPGERPSRWTDWATLTSCGPFRELAPGESVEFVLALVAGANVDSVESLGARLALLHHGVQLDLLPNATARPDTASYDVGESGVSGHEVCLAPPPGVTFTLDKDCAAKFPEIEDVTPHFVTYVPGPCIWTDLDCDVCTGLNGKETHYPWPDPGLVPPSPALRVTPLDHEVRLEWDNMPEVLIGGGNVGGPGSRFVAYRLYKLARWRGREALLPPLSNWELLASFSLESGNFEIPLEDITDTSLDFDRIILEQRHYPIGRYRYSDTQVLNGFTYLYVVTTVYDGMIPEGEPGSGVYQRMRFETPLIARFDDGVTPYTEARPEAGRVLVVPNPFKGRAGWDRSPTFGDPLPRHIDFMHLPKAVATIKIFTLAGDFVAQLVHDGSNGNGQVAWDLVSRNGQDVESGIYLFTVDSSLGHQVGKFVIVR